MNIRLLIAFFFLGIISVSAQTKVSGYVIDDYNYPVPFANIIDQTWDTLIISFIGYETLKIPLTKKVNYDLKFTLKEEAAELGQVLIVSGKQSKKNNPAIDILRKIWDNKRANGLNISKQYEYDRYEKVEFDMNTIDSALIKSRLFKGMEFVFNEVDTSRVTGKTYLPIFINEAVSRVYGDNTINKEKVVLKGNKNSGFSDNQTIIDFVGDLYSDYNIYDNYLQFFDKSFVSPLSRTGVSTYNYVLSDSTYIDNKWCYNIIYYPRRKNELTFKGDFWVADTTYAIKEINLQASKSANINWIKDIYIEQEFEVLNDSLFLVKRDYMMTDFALNKKEKSRGLYGKRTTLYDNYKFDIKKDDKFYDQEVYNYDKDVYHRDDAFWAENRLESLNKDEQGVYKMLDTLKTVKKFKNLYNLGSILGSGYIEFNSLPLDYGPIFSTFGFNEVEGLRLRTGLRTYFGANDLWRLEGFLAYGFKDDKFKYGISGKWLLDKKSRFFVSAGNKRDIEQIGGSLTSSSDILGRTDGSSSVLNTGTNDKLTNLNATSLRLGVEPFKNFTLELSGSYKTLRSASDTFSLDYIDADSETGVSSEIEQFESSFSVGYYPGRKNTGYGVQRDVANFGFPRYFAQVVRGSSGVLNSDFDYTKVQLSLFKLWKIGSLGRLKTSVEVGQTFGDVPLALLDIAPGNQTFYLLNNAFNLLDFYEFATDRYLSFHAEHNFNGRIMSRIPILKRTKLRTVIGFKTFVGSLRAANVALSTTGNSAETPLIAPSETPYYEYSVGIANILKILRIDFNFRGNYFDNTPDVRRFGITGGTSFSF